MGLYGTIIVDPTDAAYWPSVECYRQFLEIETKISQKDALAKLEEIQDPEMQAIERVMFASALLGKSMKVTANLPDGSQKTFPDKTRSREVAESIGKRLAMGFAAEHTERLRKKKSGDNPGAGLPSAAGGEPALAAAAAGEQ